MNCKGKHSALKIGECSFYQYKQEILATEVTEHITHYEATEIVRQRYVEERKSYNMAVKEQVQERTILNDAQRLTNSRTIESLEIEKIILQVTGTRCLM